MHNYKYPRESDREVTIHKTANIFIATFIQFIDALLNIQIT